MYDQETPTEVQGNVSVSITGVEDPAGNLGVDVTATSRQTAELGWVTIDTVAPALTWVDIESNNVKHSQLAKGGDTVFLTINASEWIEVPSVLLAGRNAESVQPFGVDSPHAIHSKCRSSYPCHHGCLVVIFTRSGVKFLT